MRPGNSAGGPGSLDEVKRLVKERADIAQIAGRFTKLVKHGASSFKGCCPFHKEKTPSFYVHPKEGYFYCFGCNASGDVFTLLEKGDGLSFMEALRELAQQLQIEMPKGARYSAQESKETNAERDRGYAMLERAAQFYGRVLVSESTPGARRCLEYLRERGIPDAEITDLALGWAPESGQDLLKRLTNPDDREMAERTGLVRNGERGLYEFFRSRLMIPIRDAKGRAVGFSGRAMETGPNIPKYKNSTETEWFKKKEIVYGLDRSAKLIREHDYVAVVEGYFDQWAFHRHNVPSVAVMGVAFSDDHLRALARHTNRAVLVMDSDKAGVDATLKMIPSFVKAGWLVKVFGGMEGKDPDEWLAARAMNEEELKQTLVGAPEALSWWCGLILKDSLARNLDRVETFGRLVAPWSQAPTKAHKSVLADEISHALGIPSNQVIESLDELASGEAPRRAAPVPVESAPPPVSPKDALQSKAYLGDQNFSRTHAEEAFVQWIRNWNLLTPREPGDWAERVDLFDRTPVAAAVRELSLWAAASDWNFENFGPGKWLDALSADDRARPWILKGLVLKEDENIPGEEDKLIKSFSESAQAWRQQRGHVELARLQSEIRKAPANSPEQLELSQKALKLRLSLEKNK